MSFAARGSAAAGASRRFALSILASLPAVACASLSGLTGGMGDSGADAALPPLDSDCGSLSPLCLPDATFPQDVRSETHDAGTDAADASVRHDGGDAAAEAAPACVPVETQAVSLDGGTCPVPPDASCYPQAVAPSALAWVPPRAPAASCTQQELASLGASSTPTLSPRCAECVGSTTNETAYGVEVDFPQVTFVGYGFANIPGCIAILEPCNLPCAKLIEAQDLCASEACLPSCHPTDQASYNVTSECVMSAQEDCPCGAITAAANECLNAIIGRHSPGASCVGDLAGGQAGYYSQLQAVATVLCGGLDGGTDGG